MANLKHLWKVNQKVRYNADGKWHNGIVKEVYEDHIIVDILEISDHCWFEEGWNMDMIYPDYNF